MKEDWIKTSTGNIKLIYISDVLRFYSKEYMSMIIFVKTGKGSRSIINNPMSKAYYLDDK